MCLSAFSRKKKRISSCLDFYWSVLLIAVASLATSSVIKSWCLLASRPLEVEVCSKREGLHFKPFLIQMVAESHSTAETHSDLAPWQISGQPALSSCLCSTEPAVALFMLMHALKGTGLLQCESHTCAKTHTFSLSPQSAIHIVRLVEIKMI